MAFDGTTYRGLDDDVVDEGVNIDDNPLDVFLEQSLASNSRYLMSGYNMASVPFYGSDSDLTPVSTERRWASINQARALHYPVLVTRGLTGIKLTMAYASQSEDTGGSGVNCELRLVRWNTGRVRGTVVASTSFTLTNSTSYTDTEQTIDIPTWTGTPELMYVELWIESDESADTGANVTADNIASYVIDVNASITTPEQFTYRFLKSDDTGISYDVWDARAAGRLNVYPNPNGVEEDDAVFSIYEMWYLNIRSVALQMEYDGQFRAQCPDNEELRAQESIYSTTSIPQISAARRTYSAPRIVAIGPAGEVSPEESSAQPWYNYVLEPSNEIIMDGVLQDGITGDDELQIAVTWGVAGGYVDIDVDVNVTATWVILDDGDTSWGDATIIASKATGIRSYFFPSGPNAISLRALANRENEATTAAQLTKEGIEYPAEPRQFATTIISGIVIQSTADSTRHSQPGRLQLSFTVNDSSIPSGAAPLIYVTSYAVFARAL